VKITGEAPATKAAPAQAAAAPSPPAAAAPPPKPSKIPVAAIRHEQANEEATVKLPPVDKICLVLVLVPSNV
jgi:hypothetical protein